MSDAAQSQKITVVPHQDDISFEVWDDVVHITQESFADGDQTISIFGRTNLDLIIAALSKVREQWAC